MLRVNKTMMAGKTINLCSHIKVILYKNLNKYVTSKISVNHCRENLIPQLTLIVSNFRTTSTGIGSDTKTATEQFLNEYF